LLWPIADVADISEIVKNSSIALTSNRKRGKKNIASVFAKNPDFFFEPRNSTPKKEKNAFFCDLARTLRLFLWERSDSSANL
jgi:hypothetical protein